jgi:hypothetical protein
VSHKTLRVTWWSATQKIALSLKPSVDVALRVASP